MVDLFLYFKNWWRGHGCHMDDRRWASVVGCNFAQHLMTVVLKLHSTFVLFLMGTDKITMVVWELLRSLNAAF